MNIHLTTTWQRTTFSLLLAVLGLCAHGTAALAFDYEVEVGAEGGYYPAVHGGRGARPYSILGGKQDLTFVPVDAELSLRLRKDFRPPGCSESITRCDGKFEYSIRRGTLTYGGDWLRLTAGYFMENWGETFGIYPLDVVNPKDITDYAFADSADTKLSVLGVNSTLLLGSVKVQGILVPKPTKEPLPEQVFGLRVEDKVDFSAGDDAEYGGRVGALLGGVDLNLYFYDHWNRQPVFANAFENFSETYLIRRASTVKTSGASYSYATTAMVFRGDFAYHQSQPVTIITRESLTTGKSFEPMVTNQFQGIIGVDYTTESGWTTGVQYHNEVWKDLTSDLMRDRLRHWLSAQLIKNFADGDWETKLFLFRGLDNNDIWAQPRVTWHPTGASSLSAELDLVDGKGDGYLERLRDEDRLWLRAAYKI